MGKEFHVYKVLDKPFKITPFQIAKTSQLQKLELFKPKLD